MTATPDNELRQAILRLIFNTQALARTKEIERVRVEAADTIMQLIKADRTALIDRIIASLPEKKEAKAPYDILELEKAFQNGRSKGLDEVLVVLESMR